jgi:DNA-binding sugar fermentation-stimulating protein
MSIKNNMKKVSFDLEAVIKDQLEHYCCVNDRLQSQVFREAIKNHLFSANHKSMQRQQVG